MNKKDINNFNELYNEGILGNVAKGVAKGAAALGKGAYKAATSDTAKKGYAAAGRGALAAGKAAAKGAAALGRGAYNAATSDTAKKGYAAAGRGLKATGQGAFNMAKTGASNIAKGNLAQRTKHAVQNKLAGMDKTSNPDHMKMNQLTGYLNKTLQDFTTDMQKLGVNITDPTMFREINNIMKNIHYLNNLGLSNTKQQQTT